MTNRPFFTGSLQYPIGQEESERYLDILQEWAIISWHDALFLFSVTSKDWREKVATNAMTSV